jgi:hypothetical protein
MHTSPQAGAPLPRPLGPQGNHTLTCTASYGLADERRLQGQAFSFTALNPLVVRTKVLRSRLLLQLLPAGWMGAFRRQ